MAVKHHASVIKLANRETWRTVGVRGATRSPCAWSGALHSVEKLKEGVDLTHRRAPLCQLRFGWRLREGFTLLASANQPRCGSTMLECVLFGVVFEAVSVPVTAAAFPLWLTPSPPVKRQQALFEARRRTKR